MDPADLAYFVKDLAAGIGFDRCGIAAAEPIGRADYLRAWLAAGRAGAMEYLHRHVDVRADPRALLEGGKSIIVVALLYRNPKPLPAQDPGGPRGRIARYAWGEDYHDVLKDKLLIMVDRLKAKLSTPCGFKVCVDTAPLWEREVAAAAGIGWIGKNTMVLDRRLGSYFFLGAIVTTLDLPPDEPVPDRCGTCTACLEACPTAALLAPYQMDASRCISYLTIENRGDIPLTLQPMIGEWIFGCDVCQEVCPYNRRAPTTPEPRFAVRPPAPDPLLQDIATWLPDDYQNKLRGSAMRRATLDMLQRNARVVRANIARLTGRRGAG